MNADPQAVAACPETEHCDPRLLPVLENYWEALRGAGDLDPATWVSRHPEGEQGRGDFRLLEALRDAGQVLREDTLHDAASGTGSTAPEQPARRQPVLQPEQVLGEFRVDSLLGKGGMGEVYKAVHLKLQKSVALKVLPAERMHDAAAVKRFEREMAAVGQLDHPNIVRATHAGEADGIHFLVVDYVDGVDLKKLVDAAGPLPHAAACRLIQQAATALHYAHEHGVVHRDIKPSNLIVASGQWSVVSEKEPAGRPLATDHSPLTTVKVLDFGLSRLRVSTSAATLTSTGIIMGSVDYMAPEQIDDPHAADARSDIYSLGCTLYFLLAGAVPFPRRSPTAKLVAHQHEQPRRLWEICADLPEELAAVVAKMMAKNPAERYQSMADVARALAEIEERVARPESAKGVLTLQGPRPRPSKTPGVPPRSLRRWLVAAAILLALIPLTYFFGATIVRFATNKGELVVQVDDPNVEVEIKQNDVIVQDRSTKREFVLSAGAGEVEVYEKASGLKLATKKFTLTRGGKEYVRVTLEEKKAKPPVDTGDAERRAAEWVLSMGSAVHVLVVGDAKARTIKPTDKLRKFEPTDKLPAGPILLGAIYSSHSRRISDGDLARLGQLPNLGALSLDNTNIGDAGLAHLKAIPRLEALWLDSTQVTDAGLEHLKALPNLTHLSLNGIGMRISDAGLEHLRALPNLRELGLYGTKVTNAGIVDLQKALPNCRITTGDADRDAALWVLAIGGKIGIRLNNQEHVLSAVGELPKEPFSLTGINLERIGS